MNNKINLFISSKNHIDTIEDKSKINITIPDSLLLVKRDEYFVMRLMSFYCYNTFYNVNNNNNWIRVNNQNYYLPIGNPNILEIKDSLNNQFINIGLVVSYDRITNKLIFSNNSGSSKSLIVISAGLFLGLDNNTTYNIAPNSFITSVYPISVITNNSINISITGDIELTENNLDILKTGKIETNNIIFHKLIDNKSNCLLSYENKGDNLFEYKLNNTDSINYFTINILNEDLDYLKEIGDWHMTLQFIKVDKNNQIDILEKIQEYLYDILQLIYTGLKHYNIM